MSPLVPLVVVTGAFTAVPRSPSQTSSDTAHVVIVATTDVHGRIRGWDYVRDAEGPGGLARAATILETLRGQHPDRVLLVDAGDLLQGNPFATYFASQDRRRPHPIIDAFNGLGYDVVTPGNHEFDFGVAALEGAASDATFRYVSANITRGGGEGEASDSLMFAPFAVIARGGIKIGVTGFTTPGVMVWDRAQMAGRVRIRRIAEAAPAALRSLARAGVDLKVVLIHSGLGGGSSYDTTGIGEENAAVVLAGVDPRPDVVIVGHSHRQLRDSVINGVHFVQPRNWALSLAVVHVWLVAESGRHRVTSVRADLVPLTTVPEQLRFLRRLERAHEAVRTWAATPLGAAGPGFDGRLGRAQDTPLMDLINEVQRRRTGADLSAAALFDTGVGFPEGEVRLRDLAGVYPYENTLRAVRISGQQLKDFLEHSARYYRSYPPAGRSIVNDSVLGYNFDVVSGVRYSIDLTQPVGRRIRLGVPGRPVLATDSFTLALNSYRQEGGGGYAMLRSARVVYDRGESVRDLLAAEIRRAGALTARDFFQVNWAIVPPAAHDAARAAFGGTTTAATPVGRADSTLLRVLAITDLHGQLTPRAWDWSEGRLVGGAIALKGWMDSLARACGCSAVRLDAGDQMQGTPISNLSYGRRTVEALNAIGIDAAAIGNHEFDWSVDTLRARMAGARYKFLSANITDPAGTARPEWAEPWTLIQRGGVKVAVIGLTTRETPTATAPRNVRGLAFGDGAAAIRRVLPLARAAADFVIVVAHAGAICDSTACRDEIVDVARALDSAAVDLIVAGHTHRVVNTRINGIPIVEAGSSGRAVAVVDFVRVAGTRREVRARMETPWADVGRGDRALTDLLTRAQREVDTVAARQIVPLKFALRREGGDYALGRLIADAQRSVTKADVAVMNNGGIRADLPAGMVTYGDLYQVQPFQNRLQRLTVTGDVLLQVLEQVVAGDRGEGGRGGPSAHVAGLELWYDPGRP
ncbi:MAG: 5'-nucleotidase C-terminal domain-containing protein, partial [Gemmatimonadales bacterium]